MNKTNNAFKPMFEASAPAGLDGRIMAKVARTAAIRRRREAISGLGISLACAAAFVLGGIEAFREAYVSGFGQYLSLAFTDGGAIVSDWRDFAWTIVESAPVWSIAVSLGGMALLLGAVRWTARAVGGMRIGKAAYAV